MMADTLISEFISYFKKLPEAKSICRIFERNDGYCIYGEDVKLVAKVLSTSKIRSMTAGEETLPYVKMMKFHFIQVLKYLLFVVQYKVEILRNGGSARAPEWTVVGKASPGNLTAIEDLLFTDDNSYAMAQKGIIAVKVLDATELSIGIAYCDAILREIQISQFTDNQQFSNLQSILTQLSPQECLLFFQVKSKKSSSSTKVAIEDLIKKHSISIIDCKSGEFNDACIVQDLNRLLKFREGQDFNSTMAEEQEMKISLSCVAAIIANLELLSDENNFHEFALTIFKSELYAKVDRSCEIGLGLFPISRTDFHDKCYLFGHLNMCFTSAGQRLLIQWIKQPLLDIRKIEERLDIIDIFVNNGSVLSSVSKLIEKFFDVEVIARKIQRRKATLEDLYKVYHMIKRLPQLEEVLQDYSGEHSDTLKTVFIDELKERIEDFVKFDEMISQVLDFEAIKNKEFVIKGDFDSDLSDLRGEMEKLMKKMNREHENAVNELGIPSIKLEMYDKIGYVFRVTLKEENKLRNQKNLIRIDTRNSGTRFQTSALKQYSEEYISHKCEYEKIQKRIVDEIVEISATYIHSLKLLGGSIAWLDIALSLSRVAVNSTITYVRPQFREKGSCHLVLKGLRHPCLDRKLSNFIPNDIEITQDKHRFYFVTGPNMGGKSTFIRSIALNVLMAQMGSFVPCDEAEISITDAFFTRIGASDNPSKSVSTFMHEMLEVKNMLTCATPSSLLIIDEMGRGTSTYDGFGLSWAISKHIATVIKAPCLFATHFHELTSLSRIIPSIGNLYVDAICSEGEVSFLYAVKSGVSDKSLGIQVAKLAEIPDSVIQNADVKLKELEDSHLNFEQISKVFSKLPDGDVVLKRIQEILPFETPGIAFEPMEVDDPLPDISSFSSDATSSVRLQKAKQLLDILTSMEERIKET